MKTKIFLIVFCLFSVFIFCNSINAATELWSYDGWQLIWQIVPDGKGGCAFVRVESNDLAEVVWLDKKGGLVYKTNINTTNNSGPSAASDFILFFKNKNLFFRDIIDGASAVIEIDPKGQKTTLKSSGNDIRGPVLMFYSPSELSDKKGFFTTKMDIIDNRQKLVRFSYK